MNNKAAKKYLKKVCEKCRKANNGDCIKDDVYIGLCAENDTEELLEFYKEYRQKRLNKLSNILWIAALSILLFANAVTLVFGARWRAYNDEYVCDWDWDDDHDRYDVVVPELDYAHFYIPTKEAVFVCVEDESDGFCVIQTRKYLCSEHNPTIQMTHFYINLYKIITYVAEE